MSEPPCRRCGHTRFIHQHHRAGTCGVIRCRCRRYRGQAAPRPSDAGLAALIEFGEWMLAAADEFIARYPEEDR